MVPCLRLIGRADQDLGVDNLDKTCSSPGILVAFVVSGRHTGHFCPIILARRQTAGIRLTKRRCSDMGLRQPKGVSRAFLWS